MTITAAWPHACRTVWSLAPHEIVARADADDICRPERFALQIPRMAGNDGRAPPLDLMGGFMREFSDRVPPGRGGPLRRRPLDHDEIRDYLPYHSPFHHPPWCCGDRSRSPSAAIGTCSCWRTTGCGSG